MKKRLFAVSVMLICVSILASTTLAYFTDVGIARNVITTGGVGIQIVEQQLEDGALKPYPADPIPVMPGVDVSKIVSVTSVDQPAWIRAKYTITVLDAQGNRVNFPAADLADAVIIQPEAGKWTQKDGWFYYADALGAGAATSPLFTEVSFSGPDMGNEYQNCRIVIDVLAQAVQYTHNSGSALTAEGWPLA